MFTELSTHYFTSPAIEIKDSYIKNAGLGCFTNRDLEPHTCIERVRALVFKDEILIDFYKLTKVNHLIQDYIFKWDINEVGIALGNGSIYNHSSDPNIFWRPVKTLKYATLEFWTKKKIKKGEELYIKYHPYSQELSFLEDEILIKDLYEK